MRLIIPIIFYLFLSISVVAQNIYPENSYPPFYKDTCNWTDSIIQTLSLEQKIAQFFMVAAYSNKGELHKQEILDLIEHYNIGGLMFLQGGPVRQAKLTNFYQSKSKIPLMIAIDAEWGVSMRLDSAIRFPWQMTLGAIQSDTLIYKMGSEIARQCKLLGIHINFAPCSDVNSNPKNPIINNRSFGENVQKVSQMSIAYMRGMQDNNILACAKHFPGHGDTDKDSHKTLPVVNHLKYRLKKIELVPFQELINNGLGSVMIAHLNIPSLDQTKDLPVSLSSNVVNKLLKKEMGFKGLAITDALNMKGVSNFYDSGELELNALKAGNDILLLSENVSKAIEMIKNAVLKNEISEDYINAKCRNILMSKKWMGLNNYTTSDIKKIRSELNTNNATVLKKNMIKSSLTLLQNYNNLIPLKNLDSLKIAYLGIGKNNSKFLESLRCYSRIDSFSLMENSNISQQAVILNKLSDYNLVIVGVHKSNKNPWKSYVLSKDVDVLLQNLALQSKVVLNIFANPYSLNSLLFTNNFDAILLSYQNSKEAQDQSAQAIFGGIGIKGKIPVTTKHFDIGHGINTESIRMSYVYPEEINVNKNFELKIDSIIDNAIKEKAMPGCQILIAKEGKVFFNKSYGFHTYKKKKKVKNHDVYDIASITKIVSTIPILMHLVDSGIINIDNSLGSYLELDSSNKKDLVLRDVLTHQSGLKPWIPFYLSTLVYDSTSGVMNLRDSLYSKEYDNVFPHKVADQIFIHHTYPDTILSIINESELIENKTYRYSDLGYYFFKEIIENIYNLSLNKIVDNVFYKKLGMENLGYLPLNRIKHNRIIPTEEDFEFRSQLLKGYVHDMGAAMQGGVGGHAGVFSNANDVAKIMQMYLQYGYYGGERYFRKDIVSEFTKYQFPEKNRRALGFDKPVFPGQEGGPASENASPLSFGHTGFTGTICWADPKNQILYVFLSNRVHPDRKNNKLLKMNIRTDIMEIIFNSIE